MNKSILSAMKKSMAAAAVLLILCSMSGTSHAASRNAKDKNRPVKVACIGDSVTYGYGLENRDEESYPSQLQRMLGEGYQVRNFGHNGATLLRRGHRPYVTLPEFGEALDFRPDIVVIHLGLNDTDPRDWPNWSEAFIPDYRALIDSFWGVNPDASIWICKMTPIMHGHHRFLSGTRDWHALEQRAIEQIAATSGTGLIDLYSPLIVRPDLFPDNLHPTAEGAGIMARTVRSAITGDYGGLAVSPMYSDNMVVQRDRPIVFRGMADAGSVVNVSFSGHSTSTKTGSDGRWSVSLPGMDAGGPYRLCISSDGHKLRFENVWVGEVWMCGGQSNMVFRLNQCATAAQDIEDAGSHDRLHLYNMKENWGTGDFSWPESALDSVNRLQYMSPGKWEMSSSQTASSFSAVGYHFGRSLADSLGCHVGMISCAVGGSTAESWVDMQILRWEYPQVLYNWYDGDFGQEWARDRAKKNIGLSRNPLQRHPYQPGYLFDAAIRQFDRYQIRGVLWYQGESNAHNVETFSDLFMLMVKGFRHYFGEDTAFQVVQLSGIGTRPSWPSFRDAQRLLVKRIGNAGLTVCSDLGHPDDVHPKEKKLVGERSSACVLNYVYGRKGVVPAGPDYSGFTVEGHRLRLQFANSAGLKVGEGFEIAGQDGIYHRAEACVEGETVLVWSDSVPCPCAVRYAWEPYPADALLVNGVGYPTSTFKDERFGY